MDLLLMMFTMKILIFLSVLGTSALHNYKIETVLMSTCSVATPCEYTLSDINLTVSTRGYNISMTVSWLNQNDVFQLYSHVTTTESRNVDLLILDEHLTKLIALPSPSSKSPYIILPEIFWVEEEQPPTESFEDCCADLMFLEELESELPADDVDSCFGWSEPATVITAVIRHLRWKEVIVLHDSMNEEEANAVTANLENCQFVIHSIESSISSQTQPQHFMNNTSSLPSSFAKSNIEFESKNSTKTDSERKIQDFLRTIYDEVPIEVNIHIVLLCDLDTMKSILSMANRFDQENKTALHFRSRWLISLPADTVLNDELTNFFEDLENLDNVAVIDSKYTQYKKDALNRSYNMDILLSELMARVEHVKEQVSIWNITSIVSQSIVNRNSNGESRQPCLTPVLTSKFLVSCPPWTTLQVNPEYEFLIKLNDSHEILQSKGERCTDTRVNTLYYGEWKTRYLKTVAMVKVTQEVVLRGRDDVFPNIKFALNRRNLTISLTEVTPFVMKTGQGYEGFCIDMLRHMESVLNFTAHIVEPEDGEWGQRLLNGSFNGLVGQLERQEVDMVVAPLTMHTGRAEVIDYTFPFFTDYTTVMLKMPDPKESKWRTLTQPFKWQVHLAIWVSLFSVATLITILERQNPHYMSTPEKSAFRKLSDSIWYMYGSLLTQGGEHLPTSTTGLTLVSFWLMFSVIMASTYSGNLIAFLTVTIDTPPFDSLAGMLEQNRYKWGTLGGTDYDMMTENQAQGHMLKESTDPTKLAIWEYVRSCNKSDPTVLSNKAKVHLTKVLKGDYAFIGDKSTINYWTNDGCNLTTIKEAFFPKQYAVGLIKNSAYNSIISKEIIKINDLGFFRMWSIEWWSKKRICQGNLVTEATPITVHEVQSAFYMMVIGIVLSALTLGAEKLAFYFSVRRRARRYSFGRPASSSLLEQRLNEMTKVKQDGSEISDVDTTLAVPSTDEVVLGNNLDRNFQRQASTVDRIHDLDTDSTIQIIDSVYADSLDSGYEDQQRRQNPYIFKDKVPFYLSRISLPTFLGRNRSTSL